MVNTSSRSYYLASQHKYTGNKSQEKILPNLGMKLKMLRGKNKEATIASSFHLQKNNQPIACLNLHSGGN